MRQVQTCSLIFACTCILSTSCFALLAEAFLGGSSKRGGVVFDRRPALLLLLGKKDRTIDAVVLGMIMATKGEKAKADDPLKARYRQIADAASHHTPHWPASHNFLPLLEAACNDDAVVVVDGICTTKYRAPRFVEHGPFGLVALITPHQFNPAAVPLIDECLDCFDAFVRDLRDIIIPTTSIASSRSTTTTTQQQQEQQQQQQNLVLHIIPRAAVPHICVFLVHEHPSLLQQVDATERDAWRPVDDATMQTVVEDDVSPIVASLLLNSGGALQLQLDSILLTPDGGMIAGFVDISQPQQQPTEKDGSSSSVSLFANLKHQCRAAVTRRVGTLTSRPKNLIHVTLGRVLGFGNGATQGLGISDDTQQERVVQLVQRYNEHVLPQTVEEIKQRHNQGIWQLQQLCFLRNTVWFCEENIIYKTWNLTKVQEAETGDDNDPCG